MASLRPFLLSSALSLTVVACGGDDGGTVIPEGEHYGYVANKAFVPTNNNQAREYGLDLDADGNVDNQLGMVLGTLATMGFDIQGTVAEAVAEGSIILLADFQTKDFSNTTAAGLQILLGDMPSPMPCNANETYDPTTMTGCGRHLVNGTFAIDANSPDNAAVAGRIVNGTFAGGPGNISLQLALGAGTEPIQLDLIGARAKASGITADAMASLIVAGAITEEDLNTKIIPAIQQQIVPVIAEDCTMLSNPPDCGCAAGSTGGTVLDLFDGGIQGSVKDCMVSVEEIKGNNLIKSLLAPDVEIDGVQALSLGLKAEAVKATFPLGN